MNWFSGEKQWVWVLFGLEPTKTNHFKVSVPNGTGFIYTKNLLTKTWRQIIGTTGRVCDNLERRFIGYNLKGD